MVVVHLLSRRHALIPGSCIRSSEVKALAREFSSSLEQTKQRAREVVLKHWGGRRNTVKRGVSCLCVMIISAVFTLYGSSDQHTSNQPTRTCTESPTIKDQPPQDPNADAFGYGPWHVSSDRKIWANSHYRAGDDGNKVIWIRPQGSELTITGRRIDGPSPPLRVQFPAIYPWSFQVTGLYFPTPGCWEIVAHAGNSELRITTRVEP